ncbi:Polyphenol oxidase A, chloroplastic [Capsicum annuum]|uniref:catechol oxidase n=1 Tax=Capsicum annuum TaxID=4072 RepID=A0A2G3AGD1_CAPAN|nr:Polyphenol oxidase A, chloroplastic [Capsicum annuum]
MVTNAPCPLLFFGAPYVLGNNIDAPGTIENIPHIPVHIWVGTVRGSTLPNGKPSYGEDMGNFYSAGRDPVFYCHHANVDRMWNEWKAIGGKRKDLTRKDWLNSEFLFYDENQNPWRVKIRDCLDTKKMGYDYAPMPTPWRNFKAKLKKASTRKANTASLPPAGKVFPIAKLDKAISFSITRPATARNQDEKNQKEELLTFNYIKYDNRQYIRPDDTDHTASATFQLAITELLEEIGLEDEETIAVALVPKKGGEGASIECADIQLADCSVMVICGRISHY